MFRRRSTRVDSTDASLYSRRTAVADSVWAAQDRVRSGTGTALRTGADVAKWPFERASYALRKKLIWPVEDRAETIAAPTRALATVAVVLVAAAAGVAGLLWAAPDKPQNVAATPVDAGSALLAEAKAAPEPAPEPTLHGAAPAFEPVGAKGASEVDPAKAIVKSAPADSASAAKDSTASAASSSTASSTSTSAKASSVDGPPAGPEAISTAHDFAAAFVRYETGDSAPPVLKAFGETATPALAKALLARPPRLPANVEVPQAKVVNVVPGPSHGDSYPVSVSLLRVGLTSELRLEMEQLKGDGWRVTNVLG